MTQPHLQESYIDISRFPLVKFHPARIDTPAAMALMAEEWQALFDRSDRFAVISIGDEVEDATVAKAKALWFKGNRENMARCCTVLIHVEADPDKREQLESEAQRYSAAFAVPYIVAADEAAAEQIARSW